MKPTQLPPLEGQVVVVDTECSGLHPDDGATVATVSVAYHDETELVAWAFPFDQGIRDKLVLKQDSLFAEGDVNLPEEEWRHLLDWLGRNQLVFHNAKYDLHMLATGTRHWAGRDFSEQFYWDTLIGVHILDPRESKSLDRTAARLWGESKAPLAPALAELRKKTRGTGTPVTKDNPRYDLLDWADIEPYAAKDAELTLRLYDHQTARLDAGEVNMPTDPAWLRREFDLCRALYRIERRGVEYEDTQSLAAAQRLVEIRNELAGTLPFEPSINAAKKWYFEDQGYLSYAVITEKGNKSLDEEVLRKMVKDGLPHAATYARISQIDTAVSMWYQGYADKTGRDGRLRTSFKQTFVKSGRMSVERVQLQAIPKLDKDLLVEGVTHVRRFFGARPGHILWNLDLSQAELRVAARYSGCTKMQEMLVAGTDFHGYTCETVLGTPRSSPDWDRDRDIAKRLTFGSIFLIGGKRFQATLKKLADIDMSLDECTEIVRAWRREYPEIPRTYYRLDNHAEKHRWVHLLPYWRTGKCRSWFGPRDWPHTAWNRVVQGSLAQFNKVWITQADQWCAELGHPDALVLNVHDSLVLELPIDQAEAVVEEVASRTERLASRIHDVPMTVDSKLWRKVEENEYGAFEGAL